eukprot:6765215-Prymnesium_polylepis.1
MSGTAARACGVTPGGASCDTSSVGESSGAAEARGLPERATRATTPHGASGSTRAPWARWCSRAEAPTRHSMSLATSNAWTSPSSAPTSRLWARAQGE